MAADQARPQGSRTSFESGEQLSAKVAAYVREGIMVGQFTAGAYVRTEHLAQELGVSPTPVREALMVLHSEGTVRWEPRKGYRVIPITAQDVGDLFDVQAFIAGELAARAVDYLSEQDLDQLQDLQSEIEAAEHEGNAERVDVLNHEVHRTINKASGSFRMSTLLNLTVHYVPLRFFGTIEGWPQASAHDHGAILKALRARDPEAARSAMTDHIRHIGGLLVQHLKSHNLLS